MGFSFFDLRSPMKGETRYLIRNNFLFPLLGNCIIVGIDNTQGLYMDQFPTAVLKEANQTIADGIGNVLTGLGTQRDRATATTAYKTMAWDPEVLEAMYGENAIETSVSRGDGSILGSSDDVAVSLLTCKSYCSSSIRLVFPGRPATAD